MKTVVAALLVVSLAACGTSRISTLRLARTPYLGLRCPGANSIACDRVSLAVWLRKPTARLSATIEGMRVRMKKSVTRGGYYEGSLQPAGLTEAGPMHVTPDRGAGYWEGGHPLRVRVHLVASYADGSAAVTTVRVWLHPGWG